MQSDSGDVLHVPMRSRIGSESSPSPNSTTDRSVMYAEMACDVPHGAGPGKIGLGHRLAPVIECFLEVHKGFRQRSTRDWVVGVARHGTCQEVRYET